jgi:hypothetical protein
VNKVIVAFLPLVLLLGCGDEDGDLSGIPAAGTTYDGPLHVRKAEATHPRAGAAGDIVDCETFGTGGAFYGEPYVEGATSDDPDQALETGRSEGLFFSLTFEGLRVAKHEDDRVLYVLEVDGSFKQAIVVHDGPAVEGTGGPGWYVESWARCDYSELPREATDAFGIQIWTDSVGRPVPTTEIAAWKGSTHCDWESMSFLYLDGEEEHAYVRNAERGLDEFFAEPYRAHADLPADAEATGFMRDGKKLWLSADGMRAYVGTKEDVEIWPRTVRSLGCD